MFYITVILERISESLLMCCLFGLLVIKQPQEHYNMLIFRKVKSEDLYASF